MFKLFEPAVNKTTWTHEQSYKGSGISKIIHRNRANKILKIFNSLNFDVNGKLADFGCSNGYILSLFHKFIFLEHWYFYGFDHSEDLLSKARKKNLLNTHFSHIDLNLITNRWSDNFDVTTCFETLEHVGNYRNAFSNLYISCKTDGIIIISVPNERGFPGLLKYIGRKLVRKNPYEDFFCKQSKLKYLLHLVLNKSIESFREPGRHGYGPHLGFDWVQFEKYVYKNFITNSKLLLKSREFVFSYIIYLFKKIR